MRHATRALSVILVVCLGGLPPAGCNLLKTDSREAAWGLAVERLRCEYLASPQGIEETEPRLSWIVTSSERGQIQTAYRILVASSPENLAAGVGDLWDSEKVPGGRTVNVVYKGKPLGSRAQCYWKVRAWDREDRPSPWSATASWSMGLLEKTDWTARWISYKDTSELTASQEKIVLPPPRYYRKSFTARDGIRRATAYATALGVYELHVNGRRVTEQLFTPGWSDYHKRVYYNTFDVTERIRAGDNAAGAIVADGWYSGYVGFGLLAGLGPNQCGRYFYGKTPALLVQLEIEYDDGTREVVVTDPSWKVRTGPILEADTQMGETYDARLEFPGWDGPGFDDAGWAAAIGAEENGSTKATFHDRGGDREVDLGFSPPAKLQAYPSVPVRASKEIRPVEVAEADAGTWIFNMGQNFSGVVRLKVRGAAGTRVQLRFAEMLHSDGRLMTENLRKARVTDAYVLRGDPEGETWTPRFTYHGFQYVELTGYPGKPDLDTVTGVVIHSDTPLRGEFACSDPMVNQLYSNIVWTQLANFFEVPTDCPQRDERLGWMGDAQIYVRAATYNADVAAFFTKWLDDIEEAQLPGGAYPDFVPFHMVHGKTGKGFATAWMDAGIICPYTIYKVYGDLRVINRHYDSMTRFMDFRRKNSPDYLGVSIGNDWGDWLCVGKKTPIEYIDTVYFAYTAALMSEMAEATGRLDDARIYRDLFENIKSAFRRKYIDAAGALTVDTQTAHALALFVGLIPEDLRTKTADRLAGMIEANGGRMATGFLGTRPLLPVLTTTGHNDLATALLQSREFPSWGYEVVNGATTIWERWNSYTKNKGFMKKSMNSFSHYSFGAVCEWMFQYLAGIDTDGAGYGGIIIQPHPPAQGGPGDTQPIQWVRATYDSVRGKITSNWKCDGDTFSLHAVIPTNTSATLYLPARDPSKVSFRGSPSASAEGVRFLRSGDGVSVYALDSGTYDVTSSIRAPRAP